MNLVQYIWLVEDLITGPHEGLMRALQTTQRLLMAGSEEKEL